MNDRKRVALIYKEWSESATCMVEGVFGLPEIRNRCELHSFPVPRGGKDLPIPAGFKPDGILFALDEGDPRVDKLKRMKIPVVRMEGEWQKEFFPSVSSDLLSMTKLALSHFEKRSCPNVVFLGRANDSRSKRIFALLSRYAAQYDVMDVRMLALPPHPTDPTKIEDNLKQLPELKALLKSVSKPIGIFTPREWDAVFVLRACRDLGLSVPQDAGVLCGTDSRMVHFSDPAISGLKVDFNEIGRRAMLALERLMDGKEVEKMRERVAYTGVNARASTLGESPLDQSIERVQQIIAARACEGITVEEIMTRLDMSRPTFEKRYRELTGFTPAYHIRQIRAAKARELLLTTRISVTQVARKIGFDDPRQLLDTLSPSLAEPYFLLCQTLLEQAVQTLPKLIDGEKPKINIRQRFGASGAQVGFSELNATEQARYAVLLGSLFNLLTEVVYRRHREMKHFALYTRVAIAAEQQDQTATAWAESLLKHAKVRGVTVHLPDHVLTELLRQYPMSNIEHPLDQQMREAMHVDGLSIEQAKLIGEARGRILGGKREGELH